MRIRSGHIVIAIGMVAGLPAWAIDGPGLKATESSWFHGRWQARIEMIQGLGGSQLLERYHLAGDSGRSSVRRLSVLRDYYFDGSDNTRAMPAAASGLRATGGLVATSRSTTSPTPRHIGVSGLTPQGLAGRGMSGGWSDPDNELVSVPYVGVGYTDLPLRTGWGFRADLGLMALRPQSAVKFGSVLSSPLGVDDLLRDMRLSPLIQIGVSYSF